MQKFLALLVTACLCACGSASTATHHTTNPPRPDPAANPAAPTPAEPTAAAPKKPAVEVDGETLRFNAQGLTLTFPKPGWTGKIVGNAQMFALEFSHASPDAVLRMRSLTQSGTNAKSLVEGAQAQSKTNPEQQPGSVSELKPGRWSFSFDFKASDGSAARGRFTAEPLLDRPDEYVLSLVLTDAASLDALAAEIDATLDSLKPLPK